MQISAFLRQSLNIWPKKSLVDENLAILATNLAPLTKYKMEVDFYNSTNINFGSSYMLESDGKGQIDLRGEKALSLLWNLTPKPGSAPRLWTSDVTQPYYCKFSLSNENGNSMQKTVIRQIMSAQVHRQEIKAGRVRGTLFLPDNPGNKCIITLYGGIHKGKVVEERSALLASRGFASLALAYFGVDDLPKNYLNLELDYFEEAIDLLMERFDSIGVVGISKGAELALLMATYLTNKVKAVTFINGIPVATGESYKYKGNPLLKTWKWKQPELLENTSDPIEFAQMFDGAADQKESLIPFETSKASFLFIHGQDDRCCPQKASQDLVKSQLGKVTHPPHNEHLVLPGTGHLVDLPNSPPTTLTNLVMYPRNRVNMGGSDIHLHSLGQIKAWQTMLDFFRRTLP